MGIPRFFPFINNNFPMHITGLKKTDNIETNIDNFMIDLNGLFHTSTQQIYRYGNHKPKRLLRNENIEIKSSHELREEVCQDICNNIRNLLIYTNPLKRLILCVDGTAPQSKQCQQRSRRFKSVTENNGIFDKNCLSPGTKYMDYINNYIDWFIKKSISDDNDVPIWKNIEVIFSSDKVAGEGEQKIISYIRDHGDMNESFCIYGMDADIIMLSLATHATKSYILRQNTYEDNSNDYFLIDIGSIRIKLIEILRWIPKHNIEEFNEKKSIDDFVFICFTIGNDFLPHIPSIEIIEDGIDIIIDIYKKVCSSYGHMTRIFRNNIVFSKKCLHVFFITIGIYEKRILENKLKKQRLFFEDIILKNNSRYRSGSYIVDINSYRIDYYSNNFIENHSRTEICLKYLEGLQWVLSYYTKGVPDWNWYYPFHYAPFSGDIASNLHLFNFINYEPSFPIEPFKQLLCILPPTSSSLIPIPLCNLLTDITSPLKVFCPTDIQIDLSGKRKEYEGIVLLPFIDRDILKLVYQEKITQVNNNDIKRNIFGKSFVYCFNESIIPTILESPYGNIINYKIITRTINL